MKSVIEMLRWLKSHGEWGGKPISKDDMTYFIRLAEQYFEMDLEEKVNEERVTIKELRSVSHAKEYGDWVKEVQNEMLKRQALKDKGE